MSARHKKLDPLRVPREGTVLRRVYDALSSGEEVCVSRIPERERNLHCVAQLKDFYGCEIVSRRGAGGWVKLLGRWDGPYFVPVERLDTYGRAA